MILNQTNLDQRLPVGDQIKEIQRINKTPVGEVLYAVSTSANTDVIDTLLHKSCIPYQIDVANCTARYYKVA